MLNVFIYLCLWWITRCAEGILFFFFYSRRLVRRWGGERERERKGLVGVTLEYRA